MAKSAQRSRNYFEEGRSMGLRGYDKHSCPYKRPYERALWLDGLAKGLVDRAIYARRRKWKYRLEESMFRFFWRPYHGFLKTFQLTA